MKVTFWGTRGSIAAPGPNTVRVGGNTTCLEVISDSGRQIIVDVGTGVRNLGASIMKNKKQESNPVLLTLLLTHSHWDHLAGFTFFTPAYSPDFDLQVYGNEMAREVLKRDIYMRRDNRYFPVSMDNLLAGVNFHEKIDEPLTLDDLEITTINLNHPGNDFGYRFRNNGKIVCFVTDNELGMKYQGGNTDDEILSFCREADILIHDAQFLPSEIESHRGWGHSTYEEVLDLADNAGVKSVVLTHHDPDRDDDQCDDLLKDALKYAKEKKYTVDCKLAEEGHTLEI